MGVVVGGTYFNTESGLTPLLDRLTATVDTNAYNRAVQGSLARSSSAGLTPADDPGPSFLSRLINTVTGQQQPTSPTPAMAGFAPPAASAVPPAPTVGQSAPTSISPNAQTALSFFQGKGLSPIAAAGLVGGFSNESTSKLDPNSIARGDGADGSNSIGIGNWNGPRAQALQQFASANRMDPSDINTQLQFAWSELNGPEKATLAKLQSATNPLQATVAALGYERPAGWSADNPLGAGSFGARLASTVGLAGAPQSASAYAPSQADPASTPGGRAIAAAVGPAPNSPTGAIPSPASPAGTSGPQAIPPATGPAPQMPVATSSPSTPGPGTPRSSLAMAATSPPSATASPSAPGPASQNPTPDASGTQLPSLAQIRQLVLEPATRQLGLQLWQQYLTPKDGFTLGAGQARFDARGHQIASVAGDPVTVAPGSTLATMTGTPLYQAPSNLDLKQTGEDLYGNKAFGTFNPQTGAIAPVAPQSSINPATGGLKIDPNLHGPDLLSSLPAGMASQIKAMAEGRALPPQGQALRTPWGQRMSDLLQQYDPTFEAGNAGARNAVRKEFEAGGPSSPAAAITAGNTAIQHLGHLSDYAQKLDNTSVPLLNSLKNAVGTQTGGNIAGVQFNNALNDFTGELIKFYRGTGGSEADIIAAKQALNPNQSPAQLNAAIQTQSELIQSKVNALQSRWRQGMGPTVADFPIIQPKSQAVLDTIAKRGNVAPSSEAPQSQGQAGVGLTAQSAQPPKLVNSPADAMALPSGTVFMTPNGQIKVRP